MTQEPGKFTNQLLGKYTVTQWNNLPESCTQTQPVDTLREELTPAVLCTLI